MSDVEYLDDEGHDFITLGKELLAKVPIKKAALLAFVMIIVMSSTFIGTVLAKVPGAVELDNTTNKGTFVQILVIILAYIAIDIIVNAELI